MTEQTDELIANLRLHRTGEYGVVDGLMLEAADALESTLAELRQERERADGYARRVVKYRKKLWKTQAALSRAEETIARFRTLEPLWHRGMYGCPQDMYGANQIRTILTEYGKQKGQS